MFREALLSEGPRIMEMIDASKVIMAQKGIVQWNDDYPWLEDIEEDINNKDGYVYVEDNSIIGYVCINFNEQSDYNNLLEGSWLHSDNHYATIQRLVVDPSVTGKSYGSKMMSCIEEVVLSKGIHEIRLDTGVDNKPMIALARRNNFNEVGKIDSYGIERPVFQKFI